MWYKEISQPIRDESYPHLQSNPVREEVDQISDIKATMYSKRNAVNPCDKGTKRSHVSSLLEMEQEGLGDKKFSWIGTQTVFTLLCFIFATQMSYQPRLFFSVIIPPGHPANLSELRPPLDVIAVYMPSDTTSLFQLMDKGVIATIKAYYLHQTLSFGQVRQNY